MTANPPIHRMCFRSISGNRIKYIPAGLLQKTPGLALLELKGNPLIAVDSHAFSFLPRLRKLQVLHTLSGIRPPDVAKTEMRFNIQAP